VILCIANEVHGFLIFLLSCFGITCLLIGIVQLLRNNLVIQILVQKKPGFGITEPFSLLSNEKILVYR
jgi:hypothetical protein